MTDAAVGQLLERGVLGIVLVIMCAAIAWVALWLRSIVDRWQGHSEKQEERRTVAFETQAKTTERLGHLVGAAHVKLDKHTDAHGTLLDAVGELLPPNSPIKQQVAKSRNRLD